MTRKRKMKPRATPPVNEPREFLQRWMLCEELKDWLEPVNEDQTRAGCKYCNCSLGALKSTLVRHGEGALHKANGERYHDQPEGVPQDVPQDAPQNAQRINDQNLQGSINMATILLICFIAEHNLPFKVMDHLSQLVKVIFPDSAIAAGIQCRRTKAGDMTRKLAATVQEDLAAKLRVNCFSIIIDETTDNSKSKSMAVMVKYFDQEEGTINTRMLDLLDVNGEDRETVGSSANSLYNMVIEVLNKFNIPHKNLIGFAADGTNSMMGEHNSVSSRLSRYFPGITIFKCLCHSIHICASEACKDLPKVVEDLVRNIYNHFSFSAKRTKEFEDYQVMYDMRPHRLLHPSQTRWLSLQQAVARLLELWDPLKLYFRNIEPLERLKSVTQIVLDMNDPSVFYYLKFLNDILPKLTDFNILFQYATPTVQFVHEQTLSTYGVLLDYFCDKDKVNHSNISTFDPADITNHVRLPNIYLGASLNLLLKKEELKNPLMVKDIRERCQKFLIKLCQEIKKRFDFNDPLLIMISKLQPKELLKPSNRTAMPSLSDLAMLLPRIPISNLQVLDNEWRLIDHIKLPSHFQDKVGIVHFYQKLALVTNSFDQPIFKNLSTFALQVLSLPVSNTDAERIFSKIKLIKTNTRNSLKTESVAALTILSQAVEAQMACYLFHPPASMINV